MQFLVLAFLNYILKRKIPIYIFLFLNKFSIFQLFFYRMKKKESVEVKTDSQKLSCKSKGLKFFSYINILVLFEIFLKIQNKHKNSL